MLEEKSKIRGRVARILNSREVVLNIGSANGVSLGMVFDILDPKAEDIKDPDTHDIIGSLYRPKVRIKVIELQEKLCLATTYKKKIINMGGSFEWSGISKLTQQLLPAKWETVYETLKTQEKTWENIDEKDSYVKTGDPVIQVLGPKEVEAGGRPDPEGPQEK